jgi:hypothetical protein
MNAFRRFLGLQPASTRRQFPDPAVNVGCSEFEVNNWVISEFIIERLVPVVGVHPFPLNELHFMVSAVCRLKPTHIFEWGTHIGKSARVFYETSQCFGLNLEIHSVDLPDDATHAEQPGQHRGVLVRGLQGVQLHQGDGLTTALSIYNRIGAPLRPLFFVDGDHGYDSVKRELTGIINSIPRANILLHDTFFQSRESGYNVGPHQAISAVMATMAPERHRLLSTQTGLPGMTLLYQPQ